MRVVWRHRNVYDWNVWMSYILNVTCTLTSNVWGWCIDCACTVLQNKSWVSENLNINYNYFLHFFLLLLAISWTIISNTIISYAFLILLKFWGNYEMHKNDCFKKATNENQRMQKKMVKMSVLFVLRCAQYFPMQKTDDFAGQACCGPCCVFDTVNISYTVFWSRGERFCECQ